MGNTQLYSCKQPCNNCPYRTDAPLQLWHKSEYEKLLKLDADLFGTIYKCHKNNGSICVGWLMKQDENNHPSIALRLSLINNRITREYLYSLSCPAPLYENVMEMVSANYPELLPSESEVNNTIVRHNLMNREGYSPYCGNNIARNLPGGCDNPRTVFTGKQFECKKCGWRSQFPDDFIERYKLRWNK